MYLAFILVYMEKRHISTLGAQNYALKFKDLQLSFTTREEAARKVTASDQRTSLARGMAAEAYGR